MSLSDKERLEMLDKVRSGEVLSDCMCHPGINTTGTYFDYCGRQLQPHNMVEKCLPEGIYRCVNGRKAGIQQYDCNKWGKKCVDNFKLSPGESCEKCRQHLYKTCA